MPDDRPDPDRLLARVARDDARAGRGRLKVYLGAAPGVGKTFAMLTAARRRAAAGKDVVVGLVETHGRSETESLLPGLTRLPLRMVAHGGRTFAEFDLEAALARRPQLLLVDELAHTNLPGGRHDKRWRDVDDLLAAGIDVFTTLNVQHLESVNDIVNRITGVQVRETIPDEVLDRADEVELVDLPPEALLERLREGKVYLPDAAARAVESFFRRGNLVALRELSLRRTAQWVDSQLADYRRDAGVRAVWPAGERMLVCVGPSPHSQDLLRTAHRVAVGLHAHLFAVYVQSPRRPLRSRADRDRVQQHLALAQSLGARVQTLEHERPAAALIAFARDHNVQRILVGKTRRSRLQEWLRGSFTAELIRHSGDIEVDVLGDAAARAADGATADAPPAPGRDPRGWYEMLATMAIAAGLAMLVYEPPDLSAEATLLLLGIAIAALRHGRGPAVVATLIGVAAFNFLFTAPRFTFLVDDPSHLVTFAIMLAVGLIVGTLGEHVRSAAASARERQHESEALCSLARELGGAIDDREVARIAVDHLGDAALADVVMLLADGDRRPEREDAVAAVGATDWFLAHEFGVALWAYDNRRPAGAGTANLPGAQGYYLPLLAGNRRAGVIAFRRAAPRGPLQPRQCLLLQTFAEQVGRALERLRLLRDGQAARLRADTERLRNALLSSLSHDLRTPLATICGAAGALVDDATAADPAVRRALAQEILGEADRLNDLIANVVHATRLDSDRVELRREWTSLEEIVGNALRRVGGRLGGHRVRVALPAELPLLFADPVLLEQAFFNLLDNVARHTAAGTNVAIAARVADGGLLVTVDDDASAPTIREGGGLGLGLVVVRGIAAAHGGTATIEHRSDGGGTTAAIRLPLPERQPTMPLAEPEPT